MISSFMFKSKYKKHQTATKRPFRIFLFFILEIYFFKIYLLEQNLKNGVCYPYVKIFIFNINKRIAFEPRFFVL